MVRITYRVVLVTPCLFPLIDSDDDFAMWKSPKFNKLFFLESFVVILLVRKSLGGNRMKMRDSRGN